MLKNNDWSDEYLCTAWFMLASIKPMKCWNVWSVFVQLHFEHISIENDLEEKVWMRSEEIKDQFKHDHQDWTHNHIYTHLYGAFITVFLLEDEDNDIIKSTVLMYVI